jgi:hypothetical protein
VKGGSEQHFMPPLRRDRRANTKKLKHDYRFVNLTLFSVKDVQFSRKSTKSTKYMLQNPRACFF